MASRKDIYWLALVLVAACSVAAASQTPKRALPAKRANLPSLSAKQLFKHVSPSVMVVESLDAGGKVTELGSGVVIAPGRVITNRHVVKGGVSFLVVNNDKKWPANLIKVDADHDLAELSVAGLNAPVVTVLDSSKLTVGETVYAIGSPEGLELTISEELISGLRDFDKDRVIQTSAAISPGSSGGGLFDAQGRLVGITTFYLKEGQSLNFALPAEWTVALNSQPNTPVPAAGQDSPAFQALMWFETGGKDFLAGKLAAAREAFWQAVQLKPGVEGGWYFLGRTYFRLGHYDKAVGADKRAIQIRPNDGNAWDQMGAAYWELGRYDKALEAAKEAIRLEPSDWLAWRHLAADYALLRHLDKAVSAEEQATRLGPGDQVAWCMLGTILYQRGEYSKAVKADQRAIRLSPDYEAAWSGLGDAHFQLREYARSIDAEKQAIRLNPHDKFAWFTLGFAYKATGRQSEVIRAYEKLKPLDPKMAEYFFKAAVLP